MDPAKENKELQDILLYKNLTYFFLKELTKATLGPFQSKKIDLNNFLGFKGVHQCSNLGKN